MLLHSGALPLAITPRESDHAAKSTKNLACGSIVHGGLRNRTGLAKIQKPMLNERQGLGYLELLKLGRNFGLSPS